MALFCPRLDEMAYDCGLEVGRRSWRNRHGTTMEVAYVRPRGLPPIESDMAPMQATERFYNPKLWRELLVTQAGWRLHQAELLERHLPRHADPETLSGLGASWPGLLLGAPVRAIVVEHGHFWLEWAASGPATPGNEVVMGVGARYTEARESLIRTWGEIALPLVRLARAVDGLSGFPLERNPNILPACYDAYDRAEQILAGHDLAYPAPKPQEPPSLGEQTSQALDAQMVREAAALIAGNDAAVARNEGDAAARYLHQVGHITAGGMPIIAGCGYGSMSHAFDLSDQPKCRAYELRFPGDRDVSER